MRQRLLATFAWPEDKVVVIPNGVDVPSYRVAPDPSLRERLSRGGTRKVLLALARLDPWRGLQYLLRATVQLPAVQTVIAGEGEQRQELERSARELGIEDRVDFLGHREDVRELLACSDVVVQPSLAEAFGLSALEAMCAEKPIVATAVGGTPELLSDGETALLVPSSDPEALAGAIKRLLEEPALAAALAREARRRAEPFSSQRMVESVTLLYDDLLGRNG